MQESDLTAQLQEVNQAIAQLRARVERLEHLGGATDALPRTQLLDQSFLKRAFAVLGHYLVAAFIIAIPFYLLLFLLALMIGGMGLSNSW